MNRTTRNVLWGVGFVAGLTLLGTGAANADTTGEDGTASGTQILGIIDLPVNLGGNAISVLGDSSSSGSATNGAGSGCPTRLRVRPPAPMAPRAAPRSTPTSRRL